MDTYYGPGTIGNGSGAVITPTMSSGVVASLSLGAGGTGFGSFTGFPLLFIGGGPGSGAAGTWTSSGGHITSLSLTSGGSGYTSAPIVYPVNNLTPYQTLTLSYNSSGPIWKYVSSGIVLGSLDCSGNMFDSLAGDPSGIVGYDCTSFAYVQTFFNMQSRLEMS